MRITGTRADVLFVWLVVGADSLLRPRIACLSPSPSSGDYAALILARVGLQRLGLTNRISQTLDIGKFGYAVGQGALAIVCREKSDDT